MSHQSADEAARTGQVEWFAASDSWVPVQAGTLAKSESGLQTEPGRNARSPGSSPLWIQPLRVTVGASA